MTDEISASLDEEGVLRIAIDGEYRIESIDEILYGKPDGEIGDDGNWTRIDIELVDAGDLV